MVAVIIYYTDVCDRPQTAQGLVEKDNAKQAISTLLVSVGFRGGILIRARVSN